MSQLKIKNGDSWEVIPAGGIGVPSEGITGDVLVKTSSINYATEWCHVSGLFESLYDGTPADVSVATSFQSGGIIHFLRCGNLVRCYSDYSGSGYSTTANNNTVIGQIPNGYKPIKTIYAQAIGRSSYSIEAHAMFAFIGKDAPTGHTYGDIEFNPNTGSADNWFFDVIWYTDEGGFSPHSYPLFSYSGAYIIVNESDNQWKIKFLTSGTLIIDRLNGAKNGIDLFLVGGGGAGGYGYKNFAQGAGGGGGYTLSVANVSIETGTAYSIEIGAGAIGVGRDVPTEAERGSHTCPPRGGTSSAFGYEALGGYSGSCYRPYSWGGNGGSGGGGWYADTDVRGSGGTNGQAGDTQGGSGQGTSTREFYGIDGDNTATLYSSGGNAGNKANGLANTGDGGSGGFANNNEYGGDGGSGIVIIRAARTYS